jgi:hypothetical protein
VQEINAGAASAIKKQMQDLQPAQAQQEHVALERMQYTMELNGARVAIQTARTALSEALKGQRWDDVAAEVEMLVQGAVKLVALGTR